MIAGKLDRLLLETGKVKAIRFALLDALCRELRCQPGDLFGHVEKAAPPPSLP
jgi:putative transcriptional regulator